MVMEMKQSFGKKGKVYAQGLAEMSSTSVFLSEHFVEY